MKIDLASSVPQRRKIIEFVPLRKGNVNFKKQGRELGLYLYKNLAGATFWAMEEEIARLREQVLKRVRKEFKTRKLTKGRR